MVDASTHVTMTCVSAYQHVNTWVQKVQCLENGVLSRCTVARIHLHWLLGFYSHLFRGSRKMAPTVEAQVPAKTKLPDPHNPTVASNLSLRRGPHLRYGPRDRDPPSKTRQTRASSSTVTQRFPRPEGQNKSDPSQTKLCGRPSSHAAGGPARHEKFSRLLEIQDLEDTVNN